MSYLAEPTAKQLVESVASYLQAQLPNMEGRAAFHGRVAVNVLNIVARELERGPAAAERERESLAALLGADADLETLRTQLSEKIQTGALTAQSPGLLDHLARTVKDRGEIEQPTYASLKRL